MHQLNTARQSSVTLSKLFCIGFSTPEAKLFILFYCYFSLNIAFIVFLTVTLQETDSIAESLEFYFRCTIAGDKPECEIYKEGVEVAYRPIYFVLIFANVMISAFNLGNLTYALHIYGVKSIIKKLCLVVNSSSYNSTF